MLHRHMAQLTGGRICRHMSMSKQTVENVVSKKFLDRGSSRLLGFLELNPHLCSGCGTPFQSKSQEEPGYLSTDMFKAHKDKSLFIRQQQDAIRILKTAGVDIHSPLAVEILENEFPSGIIESIRQIEDEIPRITDTTDSSAHNDSGVCICQRCFRLQQYGTVEQVLRPGWSTHDLLTPARFEQLLGEIKSTSGVVLCLVDIFDLSGSMLQNLKILAGSNPIVVAANKGDLLPKDASISRLTNWVHTEVKSHCNLQGGREATDSNRREKSTAAVAGVLNHNNVHLISCQTGLGMEGLLTSVMSLAKLHGSTVYVMGAANVGKSSFFNRLLERHHLISSSKSSKTGRKHKSIVPQATVSNLPGTTLNFLKLRLPNGVTMIDTPGLINTSQYTSRLTVSELKQVIPVKPIKPITLRLEEGKCVLIGGLAIVEHIQGLAFFFTFFVSSDVLLHPTDSSRASEFINKHVGGLIKPPESLERLQELGAFENHSFEIMGESWQKSSVDIVIAGLGWVTVTGPGRAVVKVSVPASVGVSMRPCLLPYEATTSTTSFSGGRIVRKSTKPKPKISTSQQKITPNRPTNNEMNNN